MTQEKFFSDSKNDCDRSKIERNGNVRDLPGKMCQDKSPKSLVKLGQNCINMAVVHVINLKKKIQENKLFSRCFGIKIDQCKDLIKLAILIFKGIMEL